jgi:hypothetical protein
VDEAVEVNIGGWGETVAADETADETPEPVIADTVTVTPVEIPAAAAIGGAVQVVPGATRYV